MTDIPTSLPGDPDDAPDVAALGDTPMHAAATALVTAAWSCPDAVRAEAARVLFPLLEKAAAGDGGPARRRASTVSTLVHCAAEAEPSTAPLLYALERWMLHPGRDSAAEMSAAAVRAVPTLPAAVRRRAWVSGSGLDLALADIDRQGLSRSPIGALALIAEAAAGVVPVTWLAQRCQTSRDALHRHLRGVRHETPRR